MGLKDNDGRFADNIYLTTDMTIAAYLLLREFTLLGAIDNDNERMEFGLLQPDGTEDLEGLVRQLMVEYNLRNYREFYFNMKHLRQALDNPVRRTL